MNEDVADLESIILDMQKCGGPRIWHIEELIRMVIHMRKLLEDK